jgi:hypothetical protein
MFVGTELTPDAQFYITNQIQNPVAQLFAAVHRATGVDTVLLVVRAMATLYEELL